MYELNDTIAAISSPGSCDRVIIRLSGARAAEVVGKVFISDADFRKAGIHCGEFFIDEQLSVEGRLYFFVSPKTYTGEDLAEMHFNSNAVITEKLLGNILNSGARLAGPGEFTARAYLNGKIDLSQAEAVNEIIFSSNQFQLDAAEKLLSGRVSETAEAIKAEILDCLGNLEAGMDFSQEDIEFITTQEAIDLVGGLKTKAEMLLKSSVDCQVVVDLPSVGLAGAANAGKSSLTNVLLGAERSIVSDTQKTTRDVLEGLLELEYSRFVFFDCAGLIEKPEGIIDELAQAAAVEALRHGKVVLFCVDVSKESWDEDVRLLELVDSKDIIYVATKADRLSEVELEDKLRQMEGVFGEYFLAISAVTNDGIEELLMEIDERLVCGDEVAAGEGDSMVALTARHKKAFGEAAENMAEAMAELERGNDEVATMMLRSAYQALSQIEQQGVEEKILDNIFGNFCIGK